MNASCTCFLRCPILRKTVVQIASHLPVSLMSLIHRGGVVVVYLLISSDQFGPEDDGVELLTRLALMTLSKSRSFCCSAAIVN